MNPTPLASPTHNNSVEDNADFDKDEAQLTGKAKEATHPNSDEEGKIGLDLNYPNVDAATGYKIVDGAIYIDSDDDEDDVDTDTDTESSTITRTKYEKSEKGEGRIVESEEDAECDSWLKLRLGLPLPLPSMHHQLCGQVLGSPSATKDNDLTPDLVSPN